MTVGDQQLRVLIAGGSSGLGAAIAEAAVERGHFVLAGGRRFAAPQQVGGGTSLLEIALDVQDQGSCRAAVAEMERRFSGVDVVIANAGTASIGAFEETSLEEFTRVMDVNFFGAVRIIKAAIPVMRRRNSGVIIAVSSLSGLIGLPGDSAYAASKFALEGACEALFAEVARFGIKVVVVEPGAIATEFANAATLPTEMAEKQAYEFFNAHLKKRAQKVSGGASPKAIAEEIVAIMEAPDGPLRRPVGHQARMIVDRLKTETAESRRLLALNAAGLKWWDEGADTPQGS